MNNELAHYGVKGMKWGVRKQYAPHPRQKAATAKKTPKKPEKNYDREIATALIATAATIAIGSAAYDAYRRNGKAFFDTVIRTGHTFQRVTSNPNEKLDRVYATYKKSDNVKYQGRFGRIRQRQNGVVYVKQFYNKDVIRAPSDKKAARMMKNLMDSDPEFRNYVQSLSKSKFKKLATNAKTSKDYYRNLNLSGLMDQSPEGQKQVQKYYKLLKSNGYNAISDMNDRKYNTFKSDNPLILFDMKGVVEKSVKELDSKTIQKASQLDLRKGYIEAGAKEVSAILGVTGGSMYVTDAMNRSTKQPKKKKQSSKTKSKELAHYGVKGMKWGVRKDRYSSNPNAKKKKASVKDLSDEELRTKLKRMNMEAQYVKLTSPKKNKYAERFVDAVLVGSVISLSSSVVQQYGREYLKKLKILK